MRPLCLLFSPLLAALVPAQDAPEAPKKLTAADYGPWESLRGSGALSPDGKWSAFYVRRSNGEDELRLAPTDGQDDGRVAIDYGTSARFSDDSRYLGYLVGVSEKKREQLEKQKKPVQNRFELRELGGDEVVKVEGVDAFAFSHDGKHVAMKRYRGKDRKKGGADLVVRELATGAELCFGNVGSFRWCEEAPLLAMVIDTVDEVGGGVTMLHADTGMLRSLDSHKARYTGLSWRDDAQDLAFLRITEHDEKEDEQPSHVVVAWTGLGTRDANKHTWDHRVQDGFPDGMRVVSQAPTWHPQGEAVFFGIRAWERPPTKKADEDKAADGEQGEEDGAEAGEKGDAEKGDAEKGEPAAKALRDTIQDPAGVDVWHSRDARIIPQQKKQASRDRSKSHLCALWLADGRFVRLADDTVDSVTVLEDGRAALGRDTDKHERVAMFGPELTDVYLVDTRTGARRLVLEKHKFAYGSSPDGSHFLFVKDDTWHACDVADGATRALTAGLDGDFINDERGVLTDETPPYGIAGWLKDSSAVLLHSRFDVWMVPMDGSAARRLTDGRESQLQHRLLDLDPDERWIDAAGPLYVSLYGDRTKQAGFARLDVQEGSVENVRLLDARVGSLQKAKYADTYAFVEETVTDSPDVFVAGPFLAEPKQLSETNPQQAEFAWSPKAELVDYRSTRGVPLQGALYYPADYRPGEQHPMIVYIYEKRSQNLHAYTAPSETRPYNPSVFTSLGYFVYQPDIVYRAQNPGISALECVVPAVDAVLAKGEVDPDKVGLVGHSWGAYQTAFIVSRSNLFAAGVAGAPLTNMMSMSMSIYWNSGSTDARIFHESQGRMDKPFWQDVETYMANSPIFGMNSLETPLMIAFGDEDGAVDWHQGIEMYNAARLAEKQLVMLVYDGENHSLRKKPNQVDYHWRVREWFGHYVKGEPAPKWITEGTSFLEREEEVRVMKKSAKSKGDR